MSQPRIERTDFSSHVANLLGCRGKVHIGVQASRFFLGDGLAQYRSGRSGPSYNLVDHLMATAITRLSIDIDNIKRDDSSRLGRLYARPGGFTMKIRTDVPVSTYRFVKAHELAHVLAYDRSSPEPHRRFPNSPPEERMCDLIARSILLPEDLLSDHLADCLKAEDVDRDLVIGLSRDFLITPWQVLRRCAEPDSTNYERVAGVLWKRQSDGTLRIVDRFSPYGLYIPLRDRSFREEGVKQAIWTAFDEGYQRVRERILLGSIAGELMTVAFRSEHPWTSVVQVIFLDSIHASKATRWQQRHAVGSR